MERIRKSENENRRNEYRYFLKVHFVGALTNCFYLVYSNVDGNGNMWKAQKYYLPNGVITNQQK